MSARLCPAPLATAAVLLAAVACGPPDFVVHHVFPEGAEIEQGAPVLYQDQTIGRVAAISLVQPSPERPATMQLELAITHPEITLREGDAFHVTRDEGRGRRVVRIVPAAGSSPPLASGATVRGVPPLVTRVGESVDAAVEALSELAADTAQEVLEGIQEALQGRDGDAPDAPEPEPPAPPAQPQSL